MRRFLERTILLGAAAGLLLGTGACGRNRAGVLLAPTGTPPGPPAVAAITGLLDFGTPGSHPAVLILAARVRGTTTSTYTSMELTGSFTTPTWTPGGAGNPRLTQLAPKVWVDTLVVPTGSMEWKFVANSSWASAFCSVLTGTDMDGLSGQTKFDGGGGRNLIADVAAADAGNSVCTLDENADPIGYVIQKVGAGAPAVYSAADGRFTITGLVAGTYNLLFRVPGQTPFTISNVVVGNSMKDLGTIPTTGQNYTVHASAGAHGTMFPTGDLVLASGASQHFSLVPEPHYRVEAIQLDGVTVSTDTAYTLTNVSADHTLEATFAYNPATLPGGIHAVLAYDPSSISPPPITTPPFPPTTAAIYWGAERLDSLQVPTGGNVLDIGDLDRGSYRLVIRSPMYPTLDLPVTVGSGVTDLGTLNMVYAPDLIASSINLAGDFNSWSAMDLTLFAELATRDGEYVWAITTTTPITAGVHDFKFARFLSFVDPAYGGDPATTLTLPVVDQPTRLVTGGGNSTNAIRASFPATGNYTFLLDERRQTVSIAAAPAPRPSPRR